MTISIAVRIQHAAPPAPQPKRYIGWRGLHVQEGGREIPTDKIPNPPAVIPDYTGKSTRMTKDIQLMCYDLQRRFCSAVSKGRWRMPLHGHGFAMTNKGAGFGWPDTVLRDYVNNLDTNAVDDRGRPALPEYDKIRTFQGSFITGTLEGDKIWCQPGVDGIDANGFTYIPGTAAAAATLQKIIDNHWYSIAVAVGNPPFHVRVQWGAGCVIVFPFIFAQPVAYEARFFERWDADALPEPLKIYKAV